MFWAVAALVVALISLSRVVLGVHFVSDVLAGLALAALFVVLAARVRVPKAEGALLYAVPAVALVLAALFPKVAYLSMSMGLLSGFWLTRTTFEGHKNLLLRLLGTFMPDVATLSINCFWKMKKITTSGITANTAPAICIGYCVVY